MSHNVHPYIYRIGTIRDWKSRWLDWRNYQQNLREDIALRQYLKKKLRNAGLANIETSRSANVYFVTIYTSRPGLVIGRRGEGIEEIKKRLAALLHKLRGGEKGSEVRLEVKEAREVEMYASLIAASIAEQLEQRIPFRRVIKRTLDRVASNKKIEGVKILVKGRLNGSEMARREWLKSGRLPLQALRSDIDYAYKIAYTTYGTIGVKVWIYKGERFE